MRNALATFVVFVAGFVVMVLEIIGARYLAKDFGSSFYVWVSQIGIILIALALGYFVGGALADRFRRSSFLAWLLLSAAAATIAIPEFSGPVINALIERHPAGEPIPLLWQKLDPAIGSGLLFLWPCLVLATLPPYMIRLATQRVAHVGKVSGLIIAASTVGSVAGVIVAGYVLLDHLTMTLIFRATGGLIVVLGLLCFAGDRWLREDGIAAESKP